MRPGASACSLQALLLVVLTLQESTLQPAAYSEQCGSAPLSVVENLRGEALDRPCCVVTAPGRTDCFIRGARSTVLQKTIGIGRNSDWEDIGGFAISDIACVSRSRGLIDILVIGKRNELVANAYDSQGWRGWHSLGGIAMEAPACTSPDPSIIHCLFRGSSNAAFSISFSGGSWGSYVSRGVTVLQPFGCAVRTSGRLDCFSVTQNNDLHQIVYDGGWRSYKFSTAPVKGRPSVVWSGASRLDVFVLSVDNDIAQKTYTDRWKKEPSSLGGVFDSDPECLALGDDQLHCFAVGPGRRLCHNGWNPRSEWHGTQWSGWTKNDVRLETVYGRPSCVLSGRTQITCYVRNDYREIIEYRYLL